MMILPSDNRRTRWRRTARLAAQAFLLGTCLCSLVLCPYSKVEESFGIQATHDLFYHGLGPAVAKLQQQSWGAASEAAADDEPVTTTTPYDHEQYPGVVPRTFVGPLLWSLLCQVVQRLCFWNKELHPSTVQFLARAFQLLVTLQAWFRLAHAIDCKTAASRQFSSTGTFVLIVTACQFHLPYYASRMLANSQATILTLHCFSYWLTPDKEDNGNTTTTTTSSTTRRAAACLVAAAVVFRCDMILLLFTVGLSWLFVQGELTVLQAIAVGIQSGLVCLLLTVPLDSLLWGRLVWPEGVVLYYNTVLNKSSDWGVSAWHWYFTSALPKALLLTALLAPLSVIRLPEQLAAWERYYYRSKNKKNETKNKTAAPSLRLALSSSLSAWIDTTWLPYLLPAVAFVALYSCLGHKEVRFLFPALPLFNLAAAAGLARLEAAATRETNTATNKDDDDNNDKPTAPTVVGRLAYAAALALLLLSWAASMTFVAVSRWNYPGGEALHLLTEHVYHQSSLQRQRKQQQSLDHVHVHIDVASAMTGVSRFGQRSAQIRTITEETHVTWTFDKAGYEDQHQQQQQQHHDVVVDDSTHLHRSSWTHRLSEESSDTTSDMMLGFHVVAVAQGNPRLDWKRGRIETSDAIFVWERDGLWK